MAILIDGYNLLYVTRFLNYGRGESQFRESREALMRHVAERVDASRHKYIAIVFDADKRFRHLPSSFRFRELDVYFAHQYVSADELIVELIRKDPSPKQLTVVSSDHQVQVAAKRRKAKWVDSDVWYDRLPEKPLHRNELKNATQDQDAKDLKADAAREDEDWLEFFQLDESGNPLDAEDEFNPPRAAPNEGSSNDRRSSERRSSDPSADGKPAGHRKRGSSSKSSSPRWKDGEEIDWDNPFPDGYADDLEDEQSR